MIHSSENFKFSGIMIFERNSLFKFSRISTFFPTSFSCFPSFWTDFAVLNYNKILHTLLISFLPLVTVFISELGEAPYHINMFCLLFNLVSLKYQLCQVQTPWSWNKEATRKSLNMDKSSPIFMITSNQLNTTKNWKET